MGKSTISMAMFNSYVKLPEGNYGTSPCLMGKSTNCLWPCSIAMLVGQEGHVCKAMS